MTAFFRSSCLLGLAVVAGVAQAQPASDQFEVRINIQPACAINAQDLNFGSHGLLTGPVTATSQIEVLCTNTTPFDVGLDLGSSGNRQMAGANGSIGYELFRDAAYAQTWGDMVGTDTVHGTGTGANQTLTVHGRVPAQASAAPGDYMDTVTATVTF